MTELVKLLFLLAALVILNGAGTGGLIPEAAAVSTAECHIRDAICNEGCTTRQCRLQCRQSLRNCLQRSLSGH